MIRVTSRVVVGVWSMPGWNHQKRPEDNISMLDGHHPTRINKRKASQSQELPLLLEMGMRQWKPLMRQLRHRALMCTSYGFYCKISSLQMNGVVPFFHFVSNVSLLLELKLSRKVCGPTRSESAPHLLVWVYRERCVHILYPFCIRPQYLCWSSTA